MTPSDVTFKVPATPKPKGSDLTVTTTSKERVVQTQSPFIHFAEAPPPEGLILKEGQYFARDPVSGACAVLDCKAPESKVIRPTLTSSTTPVVVSSTTKAVPTQQDLQFCTPDRDEWDSEETTIEQLQREVDTFGKKCGTRNKKYKKMKKELDDLKRSRKRDEDLRRKT